jgi:cell division protein FtsL
MTKLLICLISATLLAACVLQLRQQRLNMSYESNKLHDQIEASQAKLWNQQLQIAVYTAPNAITETVGHHELKMTPPKQGQSTLTNWTLSAAPAGE